MKGMQFIVLVLLLSAVAGWAGESERFIRKVQFPGTKTIVIVAEGDFEPQSTGSYTLRVYEVLNERFPHDNFVAGVVQPRDGAVEDVLLPDLDGDDEPEIMVIMRSAGTGGYISADAFRFQGNKMTLLSTVSGLAKGADPGSALKAKLNKPDIPPIATISEATWKWSVLTEPGESPSLIISKPENYTLTFDSAGKVNIKADCNILLGTYTDDAQSFSISTLGPSTMAFCGEQSMDRQYLRLLNLSEHYQINNGQLVIFLKDDGHKMIFNKE